MQLAKSVIDIGLSTNNLEPMLRFWQQDAAISFGHVLPVRRGQKQYRHDEQGSVIKINLHAEPLPRAAPSGYRVAREDVKTPQRIIDLDGSPVQLVLNGYDGVTRIATVMAVRNLGAYRAFYRDILSFAEQSWSGGSAFRLGESLNLLEEDRAASVDPPRQARGWRYITLQIADIDAVHDKLRGRARGPCTGNAWRGGAHIDDPRSRRQLDRAFAPGLDRRKFVLGRMAMTTQTRSGNGDHNVQIVLNAFNTLFNKRDYTAAEQYWSTLYIQHSAHIPPGREGLFGMIKIMPETLRYENHLAAATGDFVILHGRFSGFGPVAWVVADIVRMEDGLLAEHWDVIQDEATREQSRSGLPMFGDKFPA
jgi:predicted SnoaL-like aldol condensation-catalyzing enzyme